MKRTVALVGLLLTSLLLGAAPAADPDALLRAGDVAFNRGDFEAALRCYDQAEARTANPGRIAAHQAAALARLGQFAAAEQHYRCALEDASGGRRAALLFDLGNCLLRRAAEPRLHRAERAECYADAVRNYRASLRQEGASDELQADVRHNLELARLLWGLVRQERPDKEDGPEPENPDAPPEPKQPPPVGPEGSDPGLGAKPDPTDKGSKVDPGMQQTPQPTPDQGPPGKGKLKPLPDDENAAAMSPEDAARHLELAAAKIRARHRTQARDMAPANPKGRNW
jgi:Ca-activated chloride channel family protein